MSIKKHFQNEVLETEVIKPRWYVDAVRLQRTLSQQNLTKMCFCMDMSSTKNKQLKCDSLLMDISSKSQKQHLEYKKECDSKRHPTKFPSTVSCFNLSDCLLKTPLHKKSGSVTKKKLFKTKKNSLEKITGKFEKSKKIVCMETFCTKLPLKLNTEFPSSTQLRPLKLNRTRVEENEKIQFINCVSSSMISTPNFTNINDKHCNQIYCMAQRIGDFDAEFVLKLALYVRQDLNIRSTSNFLLAFAAYFPKCHPFLEKYFCSTVILPSDWIDVAEKFKICFNNGKSSLPSALRKSLVLKFLDFDEYQLAKYNRTRKEKSKTTSVDKAEKTTDKCQDETNRRYTLKSLVRQLHIAKPAYHVMCIIGKKYPDTIEKFYKSGISGTWNSELAGKRMKLKTPITWETQVSAKGNNPKVWQDLIDSKSLPYMATLRNIRNMIKAGISHKHHEIVLKYITNRTAVAKSRQFPFRFLSAYEVIEDLSSDIVKQKTYKEKGWTVFLPKPLLDMYTQCGKKINKLEEVQKKQVNTIKNVINKKYSDSLKYTDVIIERYKKALGVALDIATSDNLTPIKGRTLVACDVSAAMRVQCGILQKGSKRKLHEIGILFGLMCYSASEDCTMLIYGCGKIIPVDIEKGGILSNLRSIVNLCECLNVHCTSPSNMWQEYLEQLFVERDQWDNFIMVSKEINSIDRQTINNFLERYRSRNGSLMFYDIELSGKSARFGEDPSGSPDNIKVCGFSDHLLRYIAHGGGNAQLFYVQNIDKKWGLPSQREEKLQLPLLSIQDVPAPVGKFETIKIFVSSTLKDMLGERNILSKFVFPELRRRAAKLSKTIVECDFTWGIPNVKKTPIIQICLNEVRNCQMFVGIIGDRYGWIPNPEDLPDKECIPANLLKKSITELEIYQALNCNDVNQENRVLIYLRDETKRSNFPKNAKFFVESTSKKQKLQDLRMHVSNTLPCRSYAAEWTVSADGDPITCNLTKFAEMVLSDLWKSVCAYSEVTNTKSQTNPLHTNYANQVYLLEHYASSFVGVEQFMKKIECKLNVASSEPSGQVHVLSGPNGCGKTSILAKLVDKFEQQSDRYLVIKHFVGFTSETEHNTKHLLDALSYQLKLHLKHEDLHMTGESLKDSIDLFWYFIKLLKQYCSKKVIVIVDDIDALLQSKTMNSLQWIQSNPGDGVLFVLSCIEKGCAHSLLQQQNQTVFCKIPYLHGRDSAAVVRKSLSVYSKTLNEKGFNNQLQKLLLKKESYRPIYLKMACEYLRLFGEFSNLDLLLQTLPGDVSSMLQYWLETVEDYVGDTFLISTTLCIISCMPGGIEEEDLYHILNWLKWYYDEADLERSQFYQIMHLLSTFVYQSKTTKIMFIHTMHLDAVHKRYFSNSENNKSQKFYHKAIALYHLKILEGHTPNKSTATSLLQLPYHVHACGDSEFLLQLLTCVNFVQAKCYYGCARSLLHDYKLISECLDNDGNRMDLQKLYSCISSSVNVLDQNPIVINQYLADFGYHAFLENLEHIDPVLCWSPNNQKKFSYGRTLQEMSDVHPHCIALSPSGSKLACGTKNGMIVIFSAISGERLQCYYDVASITDLLYVTENSLLSAKVDGRITVWNDEGGFAVNEVKAHKKLVVAMCMPNSGDYVLSIGFDKMLKVWKVSTYKSTRALETTPCVNLMLANIPNCIDIHPSKLHCAVGIWNATIQIWSYLDNRKIAVFHTGCSSVLSVKYSECGNYLYSTSLNSVTVCVWSSSTGYLITEIKTNMNANVLSYIPTCNYVVVAGSGKGSSNDGTVRIWNGNLGDKIGCLKSDTSTQNHALCCAFNNDHSSVAVGFWERKIVITDIHAIYHQEILLVHEAPIRCICWSFQKWKETEYEFVISGSDDKHINITSSENLKLYSTLQGHTGPVLGLACSQVYVASTSEDFSIMLWSFEQIFASNTSSVSPTSVLRSHTDVPTCISFNENGTKLVSGGRDQNIMYWKVPTDVHKQMNKSRPELVVNNAHKDWITACCWCCSEGRVVTGSNDCLVKIWKDANLLFTLRNHKGFVTNVCSQFEYILTSDNQGTAFLWSLDGIEITSIKTGIQINGSSIAGEEISSPQSELSNVLSEDWASQVAYEEWKQEHNSKLSKFAPRKSLSSKMCGSLVIAVALDNGTIETWQPIQAKEVANLSGHSDQVTNLAYHGSTLYTCAQDKTIKFWNLPKTSTETMFTLSTQQRHSSHISCMTVSDDLLITGCIDGILKIWHMNKNFDINKITEKKLHSKQISGIQTIHPSSQITDSEVIIATGGFDGILKISKLTKRNKSLRILSTHDTKHPVTMMSVAESSVIIGNSRGKLLKFPFSASFVFESQVLLTQSKDGWFTFCFFHTKQNNMIYLSDKGHFHNLKYKCTVEDGTFISAVTHCKGILMIGDSKGYLCFLDSSFKKKVHDDRITYIREVGDFLITASYDQMVKVWERKSMKQVGFYKASSSITEAWMSTDGHVIYTDVAGFINVLTMGLFL